MITYEVAKQKALKLDSKIDMYMEYPDAFVFTNSKAKGTEVFDNEVVIDRTSGNVISYFKFVMTSKYADNNVQIKMLV